MWFNLMRKTFLVTMFLSGVLSSPVLETDISTENEIPHDQSHAEESVIEVKSDQQTKSVLNEDVIVSTPGDTENQDVNSHSPEYENADNSDENDFILNSFSKPRHVTLVPYTFTLDSDTHQLHTSWELLTRDEEVRLSSICAYGTVTLEEVSWTGESQEMSSGNSWAVNCRQSEIEQNKLEVDVDVTKFRVQPFKSYKVCVSLDDYTMDWSLEPVCTHLFSFEKYVPYDPEEKDAVSENDDIEEVQSEKQETIENSEQKEDKIMESVLKKQLSNIENFVRDDFKAQYSELKDEFIGKIEDKLLHSSSDSVRHSSLVMIMLSVLLARTLSHTTLH